jgi:prophage maintenance system killer protein
LDQINKVIGILERSSDDLVSGVAAILQNYTDGLDILDSYDHQTLAKPKGDSAATELNYNNAREMVDSMRFNQESDLFGVERDDLFKAILAQIYQSFRGYELYPTTQDKAAALLYFCVKDHPFLDGNKRIAAALFVYFLELNGALRDKTGTLIIANNTLAAVTLMIALSHPEEKDTMCLLVMNFLKRDSAWS